MGYNTFQLIFILTYLCIVLNGRLPKIAELMLKARCFQRKKNMLNCGIYKQSGEKNNPQPGHSNYLTMLLQVNKQESFLAQWVSEKNITWRTQMCILELKHKKATLLALEKKLLFVFTKGYFRDLTSQNMVHFYLVLALWNQVLCSTIWEITSFLQSFPQNMNCSSVLRFSDYSHFLFFIFSPQSKEMMAVLSLQALLMSLWLFSCDVQLHISPIYYGRLICCWKGMWRAVRHPRVKETFLV